MTKAPKESMDRVLVYRNLLAAEDHLDEVKDKLTTKDKLDWVKQEKSAIETIRDQVMPEEADSDFHCYVKHLAIAYEGQREVAKATQSESDIELADMLRTFLRRGLSMLWDAEIEICGRCKTDE